MYSSHLSVWRRQRDVALRSGLAPRKRGRKARRSAMAERVVELERENARLRRDLEKAEIMVVSVKWWKKANVTSDDFPPSLIANLLGSPRSPRKTTRTDAL